MAYLTDGFKTIIAFTALPGILFKEKEVQPPDADGGGEVDTTTMRNTKYRTRQPKHLITMGDITLHVQYDSSVYSLAQLINGLLNVNNTIVITFPDTHTLTVWGWVDKFTPASLKEGDFPMAEVKIHCSNQDNAGVEQAPAYV